MQNSCFFLLDSTIQAVYSLNRHKIENLSSQHILPFIFGDFFHMKVVIAIDSLKGSLSSIEAGMAIGKEFFGQNRMQKSS